jgi:putative oxidoreductase
MSSIIHFLVRDSRGPRRLLLIRLAVGLIFSSQGILKYIDPNSGVNRFAKIGFPQPYFTAHFVGSFEVLCGALVLLGLWTRLASIPLLIVITTAIATTKIPELFRVHQGFWYVVSDARTDFAMFCCLFFLILSGGGKWSLDAKLLDEPHLEESRDAKQTK